MITVSATKARANLFALLRRATRGHEAMRIHYRDRTAVLVPEEEFESLMETATLLSIPGLRASLRASEADRRAGRVYTMEEVFGTKPRTTQRPRTRRRRV